MLVEPPQREEELNMHRSLNPSMVNLQTTIFETMGFASRYGFGAIEADPCPAVEEFGISRVLDEMGKNGVVLSSFVFPVVFQRQQEEFHRSFAGLEKAARCARALGCRRTGTYVFSWGDELDFAENFRLHVKRLRACAEVLREYDISLGLEFLGPKTLRVNHKYEFIHTIDGMLELCDAIGTGNVGVMLDAYHCYTSHMAMDGFAGLLKNESQIVIAHVNDAPKGKEIDLLPDTKRFLPEEGGAIDLKTFLKTLCGLGYTGPVLVEPFSEKLAALDSPEQILPLVKNSLDLVWPDN